MHWPIYSNSVSMKLGKIKCLQFMNRVATAFVGLSINKISGNNNNAVNDISSSVHIRRHIVQKSCLRLISIAIMQWKIIFRIFFIVRSFVSRYLLLAWSTGGARGNLIPSNIFSQFARTVFDWHSNFEFNQIKLFSVHKSINIISSLF